MASSMFLPTCQQCQDSGAGSDACQDRHKAEGNQTVCRYIKPSSANTHITIIPASGPLQATTATATDADHDKETTETTEACSDVLRNGDALVMHGPAGQVCTHQVFASPLQWCVRIRTFWVPS